MSVARQAEGKTGKETWGGGGEGGGCRDDERGRNF